MQTVSFSATGDGQGIMLSLWMTFPVLVMSFNHYPIISPMVVRQKQRYGPALAEGKCAQIQRYGILLMTVVVLFFVLSCVLSLSPQQLAEAKAQNLSILSYLANQYDTPIIAWLSPIIAFVAITKSFLGHYIGAYESLRDLILEAAAARGKKPGIRLVDAVILVFMVLTCWFAAYKNPSILGIIECISGPTGAAILLLLPMYAIHKLPVLAPWRGKASNVFVTLIGLITVSAIFLRHVPITTIISEMLYDVIICRLTANGFIDSLYALWRIMVRCHGGGVMPPGSDCLKIKAGMGTLL